ncbi:helix-turn-helix domain-containing protein [Pseudorhodoferax sp.]|uniref:helix-turn-helix domain-containing protein n=1 Tax=Pseudorhodoferax sp. TaxID=1993553 RepID=UPI002DD682AE|nr:helix-turn-helix domain-containing protein [Pseudorhodoferax sp.]
MQKPSPEKAKGPTVAPVGPLKTGKSEGYYSKSPSSEAQRQRILAALLVRPQTSYDLRRLGCYQAPARIKELRDRFGYVIETTRVTLWDRDGYPHPRAALYSLISAPEAPCASSAPALR